MIQPLEAIDSPEKLETEASRAQTLPPPVEPSVAPAPPASRCSECGGFWYHARQCRNLSQRLAGEACVPSNPPGFAILEIMGHRKRAGWVEEVQVFGQTMARIHIPTSRTEPKATRVEDYGGASIFGTRWCDEATARAVALELEEYAEPAHRQLLARYGPPVDPDSGHDDDDQVDDYQPGDPIL